MDSESAPRSRVLYTGDGRQRRAEQLPDVIRRVVGGGGTGNVPADGSIPAKTFSFGNVGYPRAVGAAADGTVFIARDGVEGVSRIYRVDRAGMMSQWGCFGDNSSSDGISALEANCNGTRDLAVAPDGTLYLTIGLHHLVRKITPDGKIWTVAGVAGEHLYNGDGIPATEAHLWDPRGLALGQDGSVYVADGAQKRIRRVDPRGTIWTVAGGGGTPPATGVPAAAAAFTHGIDSVALDASGNLYLSVLNHRIWKVSPDGVLHHFAGNGNNGQAAEQMTPPGDGQPAVEATIPNATGLAVGRDGSVYFATQVENGGYHSVRRVAPNGIISTVAGAGPFGSSGDGGPAAAALLSNPLDVEVAPDGSIYVSSQHLHVGAPRVRKIEPAFPGAAAGTISITSEDGQERSEFDGSGKHQATYETTGNTVLYTFGYDAEDRLTSITDGDGDVTTIEYDGQGNPVAIVAPFGQRTTLASDAEGWLSSVTDPAGGEYGLVSQPDGLLTSYTDPNGASASYEYGAYGYLVKDTDRAGGWLELARTDASGVSEVTITSRLGRTRSHRTERLLPDGAERLDEAELRTTTDAAGLETTQLRDVDEVRTVTSPQGVVSVVTPRPDFRFGMASPLPGSLTIETPGGRTLTRTRTRTGAMAGSAAPLPGVLTDQTDTIIQNGRTSTVVWDHDTAVSWNGGSLGLRRITSAASRIFEEALDARGRVIGARLGTMHPVELSYDLHGRVESLVHGPGGAGDRATTFAYDATTGRLASITDPASRITSFDAYDDAGRALQMTLPGGRVVAFDYDANGNLTSLSPPGRPAHIFRYTPVDLESEYEPPAVTGIPDTRTVYEYDLDRSLTLVTRPDGKTVDLDYEPATGRLETVTIAEGAYAYGYHTTTDPQTGEAAGQLATLTAPGGQSLAYSWDGTLPTETTWSGPVAGSVARSFDDDFRVETESVNGSHTVSYQYDPDSLVDLVDQATGPDLALVRDAGAGFGAGLLTGTTQGSVATTETPSPFGELASLVATESSNPLYSLDVSARDLLGRIATKIETIGTGPVTTSAYTYDAAGRLDTVTVNGTLTADYAYDANGNRTHEREDLLGPPIAVYDDQDRLLIYDGTTYTYSAAGDLETSTDASGTTTYGYDALGNLRSVVLPDGEQLEYGIDGQNRRVAKKVCPAPCTPPATPQPVQGFLYGDQLRIVAELDGSNDVVSRFVYATRVNLPDFMVKGGVTYRILSDQVGSVRLVVNADNGAIVQRIDYDSFGVVTQDTNPGFQPFGFAGGLMDPDTGLVRFGARDYDPQVGRWTSKDPIRFDGRIPNLFAYGYQDPINQIDPNGHEPRSPAHGQPPNSQLDIPDGRGGRTTRLFGSDGRATTDYDYGHDHGAGDPHAHDWDWSQDPPRQPGRPVAPNECPADEGPEERRNVCEENPVICLAAGGAGGYATYRVLRMIPSMLPPLWPSIPLNLALP
ncbi:MAG: hypothetical protein M5U32_15880 [Myxococcota bacterium]|nr:hypothetical protein [Myxococcota bacterium]